LFIPGDFTDAFVYMGHLLAIDSNRDLVAARLHTILTGKSQTTHPFLDALYLNNSQLADSEILPSIMQVPGVVEAVTRQFGVIEPNQVSWTRIRTPKQARWAGAILDLQIYARRAYVSSTKGLFSIDLDFDGAQVDVLRGSKRLDARCLSTTARHGAVVASCGDDGLFAAYGEVFQRDTSARADRRFKQSADTSQRASWVSHSLVNYRSASDPELLRGRLNKTTPINPDNNHKNLAGLDRDEEAVEPIRAEIVESDYIFNNRELFLFSFTDGDYSLTRYPFRSNYRRFGHARELREGQLGEVLSAYDHLQGMVVETYDGVYALSGGGTDRIYSGSAIRVRTFPAARNHRHLVAVIDESGINLFSPLMNGPG
jgi:hypothetical protein